MWARRPGTLALCGVVVGGGGWWWVVVGGGGWWWVVVGGGGWWWWWWVVVLGDVATCSFSVPGIAFLKHTTPVSSRSAALLLKDDHGDHHQAHA